MVERISYNVAEFERVLAQAKKLAQQRQASMPPEDPTNRRARLAREERQRVPWSN